MDHSDSRAALQHVASRLGECLGIGEAFQRDTVEKCLGADGGDLLGEGDALQGGAARAFWRSRPRDALGRFSDIHADGKRFGLSFHTSFNRIESRESDLQYITVSSSLRGVWAFLMNFEGFGGDLLGRTLWQAENALPDAFRIGEGI